MRLHRYQIRNNAICMNSTAAIHCLVHWCDAAPTHTAALTGHVCVSFGGVASWRSCSGVTATCSMLVRRDRVTRIKLLAAKTCCREGMVAPIAIVVQMFQLPSSTWLKAWTCQLSLAAVKHLMMSGQATWMTAAFCPTRLYIQKGYPRHYIQKAYPRNYIQKGYQCYYIERL